MWRAAAAEATSRQACASHLSAAHCCPCRALHAPSPQAVRPPPQQWGTRLTAGQLPHGRVGPPQCPHPCCRRSACPGGAGGCSLPAQLPARSVAPPPLKSFAGAQTVLMGAHLCSSGKGTLQRPFKGPPQVWLQALCVQQLAAASRGGQTGSPAALPAPDQPSVPDLPGATQCAWAASDCRSGEGGKSCLILMECFRGQPPLSAACGSTPTLTLCARGD